MTKLKEELNTARKLAQESLNEKESDLQDQLEEKCREADTLQEKFNVSESKFQ
jgi:hypothetical protein